MVNRSVLSKVTERSTKERPVLPVTLSVKSHMSYRHRGDGSSLRMIVKVTAVGVAVGFRSPSEQKCVLSKTLVFQSLERLIDWLQ